MLTKEQLLQQLELQDKMNRVVNPDWLNAGYLWTRAIMVEAVEALDHYGWKWWKKDTAPDVEQVRIELIDIWHFILSNELAFTKGDHEAAAQNFLNASSEPEYFIQTNHNPRIDLRELANRELLHVIAGAAAFNEVNFTAVRLMMQRMGLTPDMLHSQYIQKNVLNLFRQAHGYKTGEYIKDWLGQEDNEVLASIVAAFPSLTPAQLDKELEHAYAKVVPSVAQGSEA